MEGIITWNDFLVGFLTKLCLCMNVPAQNTIHFKTANLS